MQWRGDIWDNLLVVVLFMQTIMVWTLVPNLTAIAVIYFFAACTFLVFSTRRYAIIVAALSCVLVYLIRLSSVGYIPIEQGLGATFTIWHWATVLTYFQLIATLIGVGIGGNHNKFNFR